MNIKRSVAVLLVLLFPFLLFACGNSGGGGAVSSSSDSSSGTFTINTSGADGGPEGGSGGTGGDVVIIMPAGSMGELQVMASGAADASFTPSASTPKWGGNKLPIEADTTIEVLDPLDPADEPADGTPYMVANTPTVFIWNITGTEDWGTQVGRTTVTGISVDSGATLTLELNYTTYAWVTLSHDIDNNGAITTDDNGALRGNLRLDPTSYHGNGAIDTSGTLDGQDGGYLEMHPIYFFNRGTINTSGAESTTGAAGNGGYVVIDANNGIENTGNITADGGTTSAAIDAFGGNAGFLVLQAWFSIYNSGNLSCRGGDGVESGGNGNSMNVSIDTIGNLHNSGNLDTSGGAASGAGGGSGGSIDMSVYGGDIVNSGNLTTKGGGTTDPSSDGGDGGYIYLYVSSISFGPTEAPAGDILFSGNVDTSGGLAVTDPLATGSGGSGDYFVIEADYYGLPLGQQIALLGYAGIDASGGNGNDGGIGGNVQLSCDYGNDYREDAGELYTPSCNITNEVDINAAGGSVVAAATTGYGGSGGSVDIWTDEYYGMFDPNIDKVVNSGNIDTSSGDSLEADVPSGGAGSVSIWGFNGVTNSGNITAGGGHDLGTDGSDTGVGNEGNDVELYAGLGPVSNSGNLTTNGGDGEYRGGNAYAIWLFGPEVSNSGALAANGGDADTLLADSVGGDGADVELFSPDGLQGITQTGTVTNHGGTGKTPGSDGNYYLGILIP